MLHITFGVIKFGLKEYRIYLLSVITRRNPFEILFTYIFRKGITFGRKIFGDFHIKVK